MTKRYTNIVLSAVSLWIGGIVYVLFRKDTHIAKILSNISFVEALRIKLQPISSDFLCFYLPDLIWCLALGCGLQAIFANSVKASYYCGFGALFCGIVWECLQFGNVVSGTGDVLDVVSYFCGSALCVILNLKERKQ